MFERVRGADWQLIGDVLDVPPETARVRFAMSEAAFWEELLSPEGTRSGQAAAEVSSLRAYMAREPLEMALDLDDWVLRHDHVYEVARVARVARLPVLNELADPARMTGRWVWVRRRLRRRVPWLVPAQKPRDCCWHHRVDWRSAAGVAVRLVRQAQAAGIPGEQIGDYVMGALFDEGLDDREERAVVLLVGSGAGILPNDEPNPGWLYHDGQHRVAAQLDQGVPQTIIQRFELLDAATGRPITD